MEVSSEVKSGDENKERRSGRGEDTYYLPEEIWTMIFEGFELPDLISASIVNKQWKHLLSNDAIWCALLQRMGIPLDSCQEEKERLNISWKDYYMNHFVRGFRCKCKSKETTLAEYPVFIGWSNNSALIAGTSNAFVVDTTFPRQKWNDPMEVSSRKLTITQVEELHAVQHKDSESLISFTRGINIFDWKAQLRKAYPPKYPGPLEGLRVHGELMAYWTAKGKMVLQHNGPSSSKVVLELEKVTDVSFDTTNTHASECPFVVKDTSGMLSLYNADAQLVENLCDLGHLTPERSQMQRDFAENTLRLYSHLEPLQTRSLSAQEPGMGGLVLWLPDCIICIQALTPARGEKIKMFNKIDGTLLPFVFETPVPIDRRGNRWPVDTDIWNLQWHPHRFSCGTLGGEPGREILVVKRGGSWLATWQLPPIELRQKVIDGADVDAKELEIPLESCFKVKGTITSFQAGPKQVVTLSCGSAKRESRKDNQIRSWLNYANYLKVYDLKTGKCYHTLVGSMQELVVSFFVTPTSIIATTQDYGHLFVHLKVWKFL